MTKKEVLINQLQPIQAYCLSNTKCEECIFNKIHDQCLFCIAPYPAQWNIELLKEINQGE